MKISIIIPLRKKVRARRTRLRIIQKRVIDHGEVKICCDTDPGGTDFGSRTKIHPEAAASIEASIRLKAQCSY